VSGWEVFLICESMIESIFKARERFLAPNGIMMPSSGQLILCPMNVENYYNSKIEYFDNVYGVQMSSLKQYAAQSFFCKPIYSRVLKSKHLIAKPALILHIDMGQAHPEELELNESKFKFVITRSGPFHGFVSWFDVRFDPLTSKPDLCATDTVPYWPPSYIEELTKEIEGSEKTDSDNEDTDEDRDEEQMEKEHKKK